MENLPDSQLSSLSNRGFKNHFYTVTSISKVLAAVVFITFPFIGFYVGLQYATPTTIEIPIYATSTSMSTSDQSTKVAYKKTVYLGAEIPTTWSEFYTVEPMFATDGIIPPSYVKFSFSDEFVSTGDGSQRQINFHYMTEEGGATYLRDLASRHQAEGGIKIEERSEDGVLVTVVTYPPDSELGQTKDGGGGSDYLIKILEINEEDVFAPSYLLITKPTLGDEEFEAAFAHLIDSIDFKKVQSGSFF